MERYIKKLQLHVFINNVTSLTMFSSLTSKDGLSSDIYMLFKFSHIFLQNLFHSTCKHTHSPESIRWSSFSSNPSFRVL